MRFSRDRIARLAATRVARIPPQRVALAALVIAVVVIGAVAATIDSGSCGRRGKRCAAGQIIRWSRPLPGSWVAVSGVAGTTPLQGQAYAAAGAGVAVIGFGTTVHAYDAATGLPRWTQSLDGVAAGSVIVSVRAWHGVITVGVASPGYAGSSGSSGSTASPGSAGAVGSAPSPGSAGAVGSAPSPDSAGHSVGAAAPRQEIVLDVLTGKQLRTYPAARSGGAAWATLKRTVIIGEGDVASYANGTGRAIWRDPTGPAEQAWLVAGRKLYVTVSASGQIGTAPVTAVRQIDLRTGEERLIQPPHGSFDGMLADVLDGVLVFSGSSGLSSYSAATGHQVGRRPGAVLEGADTVQRVLYADIAGVLTGVDPVTLQDEPYPVAGIPQGAYGVRAGVAVGVNPGPNGAAWGYSIAKRRIIWTARPLPWPHFFADPLGSVGSVEQDTGTALLVTCAATGQAVQGTVVGGDGRACLRPRLVAIGPLTPAS